MSIAQQNQIEDLKKELEILNQELEFTKKAVEEVYKTLQYKVIKKKGAVGSILKIVRDTSA